MHMMTTLPVFVAVVQIAYRIYTTLMIIIEPTNTSYTYVSHCVLVSIAVALIESHCNLETVIIFDMIKNIICDTAPMSPTLKCIEVINNIMIIYKVTVYVIYENNNLIYVPPKYTLNES